MIREKVKGIIKKNSFMTSLARKVREQSYSNKCKKYRNEKIDRYKILMSRAGAGYGDNTRAIAEELHKIDSNIRIIWACNSKMAKESLPDYVTSVDYESDEYFREMATSSTWVHTTLVPQGTTKKKNQLYIQTWHGDRGFKKIANDAIVDNANYQKVYKNRRLVENDICDYVVTGSTFSEKMYRSAFAYEGEYLKVGLPRNDCLFNIDIKRCEEIKRNIGVDTSYKIVIYAPTFRDTSIDEGKVDSNIGLECILDRLEKNTNEKWVCIVRAHSGERLITKNGKNDKRILDVTRYPDMADLLMISDMLITDYSSCATDFIFTGRPILIYQDDIDDYVSNNRRLYFDMKESPFWVANNMEEALKIIDDITPERAEQNDKAILDFYGTYENGNATKEVCKVIYNHIVSMENN